MFGMAVGAGVFAVGGVGGCHSSAHQSTASICNSNAAEVVSTNTSTGPAAGQPEFESPDAAVAALVAAATSGDRAAVHKLFGPSAEQLSSGDAVADANDFKAFATHAAEGTRVEQTSDSSAAVYIGGKDWPLPVPLVKAADGKWYFDTEAGKATILARRIGHNELETIAVLRAYVAAQRVYGGQDRDGDGVLQYAQRLNSKEGKHDGLYWPVTDGQSESPFGPLAAQAAAEGYGPVKGAARSPFHGYLFRVLTKQGSNAPGGAYDYVINGRMLAGYGLVAWPDKYGVSGVMTFVVNQYGAVYEKDLGSKTGEEIASYDPDSTWAAVK